MTASATPPDSKPVVTLQRVKHAVNELVQYILAFPPRHEFTASEWEGLWQSKNLLNSNKDADKNRKEEMLNKIKDAKLDVKQAMQFASILDKTDALYSEIKSMVLQYAKSETERSGKAVTITLGADTLIPIVASLLSVNPDHAKTIEDQGEKINELLTMLRTRSALDVDNIGPIDYVISCVVAGVTDIKLKKQQLAQKNSNEDKLKHSSNVSDELKPLLIQCEKAPNDTIIDLTFLKQKQSVAVFSALKLVHTLNPNLCQDTSEDLLELSKRDDLDAADVCLVRKNVNRYIPATERWTFSKDEKEYKNYLSSWTKRAWDNIYNEFKAITNESKNVILDSYTHVQRQGLLSFLPRWTPKKFKNKDHVEAFIKEMNDITKEAAPSDVLMKKMVNKLVDNYVALRKRWMESKRSKEWFEKRPSAVKDEQYYPHYLATETTVGHHYARMILFVLYKLASIGALDINNHKPPILELNPLNQSKTSQLCMTYCERSYPELTKLMGGVVTAASNLPSMQMHRKEADERVSELELLSELIKKIPVIPGDNLKTVGDQFKTEYAALQKFADSSLQKITTSKYPGDVRAELKAKVDSFSSRYSGVLKKLDAKEQSSTAVTAKPPQSPKH